MRKCLTVLLGCWLAISVPARAQTLNQEMAGLAAKLSKTLAAQGLKNIATVDFTDLQGQPTELGRYLSERLAVELVSVGGVTMLDRANIKSILAEHKLTEAGLVNPANAKKLGEFAGVDVILIGNVTTLDGVELMVKAISTGSSMIVGAGRIAFPKTSDIQQLLNRSISSAAPLTNSGTAPGGDRISNRPTGEALAVKEIGSLRLVLKSCSSFRGATGSSGWERQPDGIRCSVELVNLSTQSTLALALNASAPKNSSLCSDYDIGAYLRTVLLDDSGAQWLLRNSAVTGLGVVGVGHKGGGCSDDYNPTEIVGLLQTLDETGSNIARSRDGASFAYMFGSLTPLNPGQSRTVSLAFIEGSRDVSTKTPKFFEFQCEIAIRETRGADAKPLYSLENLSLEQIRMPARVR